MIERPQPDVISKFCRVREHTPQLPPETLASISCPIDGSIRFEVVRLWTDDIVWRASLEEAQDQNPRPIFRIEGCIIEDSV